MGFPGGSDGRESAAIQETRVLSLGQKIPGEGKWQPTPIYLPGKSHGQKNLEGYSSWDGKEPDTTE